MKQGEYVCQQQILYLEKLQYIWEEDRERDRRIELMV